MPGRPNPPKGGETELHMSYFWHELLSLVCAEMLVCPFSSFSMSKNACFFLPTASLGNGKFGSFLLGVITNILCGPEGTSLERVSSSTHPARCNTVHDLLTQRRAEWRAKLLGMRTGKLSYQTGLPLSCAPSAEKGGRGCCKHNNCTPRVSNVEIRLEKSCELIVC